MEQREANARRIQNVWLEITKERNKPKERLAVGMLLYR